MTVLCLLFLYNTGVRASEAAQLTVGDLQLTVPESHPSLATVHGKGGKVRQCPLWPRTTGLLAALVDGRPAAEQVFLNRHGQPITRFGIGRLVGRYATVAAARAPSLIGKRVSPHVIRHTTATHLLRAGVDLNTIPGVARPRQTGHDQCLRRNRPRDEGQGNRSVRRNRTASDYPVAGGHRLDGVPANAVSRRRYVALIESRLLTPQGETGRTQHNRQRNIIRPGSFPASVPAPLPAPIASQQPLLYLWRLSDSHRLSVPRSPRPP